jgi:hypothetical protein
VRREDSDPQRASHRRKLKSAHTWGNGARGDSTAFTFGVGSVLASLRFRTTCHHARDTCAPHSPCCYAIRRDSRDCSASFRSDR